MQYIVYESFVICRGVGRPNANVFLREMEGKKFEDSGVYRGKAVKKREDTIDTETRLSQQLFVPGSHPYIADICKQIDAINKEVFKIQISDHCKENTLVRYTAGGHFTEHSDLMWPRENDHSKNSIRKLTSLMLISNPSDFKGGELRIRGTDRQLIRPQFEQGDLIVFSSHTPHVVAKLTEGIRYSLVMWSHGNF